MNEVGYINDQEWDKHNLVIKDFKEVVPKDFSLQIDK